MAVSKLKLRHFIEARNDVKNLVIGSESLNTEIIESAFFRLLNKKFKCSLAKHDIILVEDLVAIDYEKILKAVSNSQSAIVSITKGLRKILFSHNDNIQNPSSQRSILPHFSLIELFSILNNCSNEELDQTIDLGSDTDVRLYNAFMKAGIYKYSDLKDRGILEISNIKGLGKKSFKRLLSIAKEEFKDLEPSKNDNPYLAENNLSQNETLSSLEAFRNSLSESFSSGATTFCEDKTYEYEPTRAKLFDSIFEYVATHYNDRKKRIYIMRMDPTTHRTLEEVGRSFGVTKERIRQIVAKIDKSIRYSFMSIAKCRTTKCISDFYKTFLSIPQDELPLYVSLLVSEKNVISDLIKSHLRIVGIDNSLIPKKEAKRKAAKEKNKSTVKKIERKDLTCDEKLTYSALTDALATADAITPKALNDFINGLTSFGKNKFYFNSRQYFSTNYDIDSSLNTLIELGLVNLVRIESAEYLCITSTITGNKKVIKRIKSETYKRINSLMKKEPGNEECQYIILAFVNSYNNKYDIHTIVNVLMGEETSAVKKFDLQNNRFFAECDEEYTKTQIYHEIYRLKKSRYLSVSSENKKTSITKSGKKYLLELIRK